MKQRGGRRQHWRRRLQRRMLALDQVPVANHPIGAHSPSAR